jgi:hypothetical protein
LGDGYGLSLCDIYSETSLQSAINLALKFQDFRDFKMAATCYQNTFHSVINSVIRARSGTFVEYIKVHGIREQILEKVTFLPQLLDLLRKAIDLYELLGRNLDVAFCRYHLAQLLPPAKAIDLYSQAIYQFGCSAYTHHRERGTLDQCYSLVEAEEYSAAIASLEILQHQIGYCGKIYQLRCKELLVECHCRSNATRPALQAVRETIKAMEESEVTVGPKLQQYRHLLIALDGKNTPPSIAFYETVPKGHVRIWVVETNDEEKEMQGLPRSCNCLSCTSRRAADALELSSRRSDD